MSPLDVHARLVAMFPEFARYWDAPTNYFRERDGSFTLWGVFAEFSHYFQEHFALFSESALAALARFIDECMTSSGSDIDNAATTCFLENLAGHDSAAALRPFFGRQAEDFLA